MIRHGLHIQTRIQEIVKNKRDGFIAERGQRSIAIDLAFDFTVEICEIKDIYGEQRAHPENMLFIRVQNRTICLDHPGGDGGRNTDNVTIDCGECVFQKICVLFRLI